MHLNPESLSFALLISDLGSIARAANILGMKQATLSRKLTALESRVGVRLFDRSTRGAVPTVSGAGFLNQARRIVADLDTLLTSSRAAASGEEGKLGIGFSTSLRNRCSDWAELPTSSFRECKASAKLAEGEELGSNLLHVAPGTPASSAGRGSWQRRAKGRRKRT